MRLRKYEKTHFERNKKGKVIVGRRAFWTETSGDFKFFLGFLGVSRLTVIKSPAIVEMRPRFVRGFLHRITP